MPTADTMTGQLPSVVPEFDASRAILKGPDMFTRFRVTDEGEPLALAGLRPDAQLIVFQIGQHRRAFDRLQMAYRHIAQGEVDGQTFVIAYCGVCNMAAGLTPVVNGRVHHFSLGGVYNGMMLMIDDETQTYWDFVTGQALHGKLAGACLDSWGVTTTTVEEALHSDPDLRVYLCPSPFFGRLVGWADRYFSGWLPPGFRRTMTATDDRLREMEPGLGIVSNQTQRFYPRRLLTAIIKDEFDGRTLTICVGSDGIPMARWPDATQPIQFLALVWVLASLSWLRSL